MPNIQQSVNSVLTTGATLKTLSQGNEIRKSNAELIELKKELLKQQIENTKNTKISGAYVDILKNPMKVQEIKPEKDLYNNPNSNLEFAKSMKSANDFYNYSYNSLNSFMEEYDDRKSNGGNE